MKTISEINKAIEGIAKRGAQLDKDIQDVGVSVLEHFTEHKDTGLVNRLYLALPAGSRKSAMASWLMAYCAVNANTDPAAKKEQPFTYAKDKTTNAVGGAQDPWYNHKPEKAPDEIFDLQKAVKGILAKMAKAPGVSHVNGDTITALKALAVSAGIPESDVPSKLPGVNQDDLNPITL